MYELTTEEIEALFDSTEGDGEVEECGDEVCPNFSARSKLKAGLLRRRRAPEPTGK